MSYSDFADWVDFAYWWSFSGGGSVINVADPVGFIEHSRFRGSVNCRAPLMENRFQVAKF